MDGDGAVAEDATGKEVTELWLANLLRPYGIQTRNLRIDGVRAKRYVLEDFGEVFRRYVPWVEVEALKAELWERTRKEEAEEPAERGCTLGKRVKAHPSQTEGQ